MVRSPKQIMARLNPAVLLSKLLAVVKPKKFARDERRNGFVLDTSSLDPSHINTSDPIINDIPQPPKLVISAAVIVNQIDNLAARANGLRLQQENLHSRLQKLQRDYQEFSNEPITSPRARNLAFALKQDLRAYNEDLQRFRQLHDGLREEYKQLKQQLPSHASAFSDELVELKRLVAQINSVRERLHINPLMRAQHAVLLNDLQNDKSFERLAGFSVQDPNKILQSIENNVGTLREVDMQLTQRLNSFEQMHNQYRTLADTDPEKQRLGQELAEKFRGYEREVMDLEARKAAVNSQIRLLPAAQQQQVSDTVKDIPSFKGRYLKVQREFTRNQVLTAGGSYRVWSDAANYSEGILQNNDQYHQLPVAPPIRDQYAPVSGSSAGSTSIDSVVSNSQYQAFSLSNADNGGYALAPEPAVNSAQSSVVGSEGVIPSAQSSAARSQYTPARTPSASELERVMGGQNASAATRPMVGNGRDYSFGRYIVLIDELRAAQQEKLLAKKLEPMQDVHELLALHQEIQRLPLQKDLADNLLVGVKQRIAEVYVADHNIMRETFIPNEYSSKEYQIVADAVAQANADPRVGKNIRLLQQYQQFHEITSQKGNQSLTRLLVEKRQLDELAESDVLTHTLSDSAELQNHNPQLVNSSGSDMPVLWNLIQHRNIDTRICDSLIAMEKIPSYLPASDYQLMDELLKKALSKETDPTQREKLGQAQEKLAIAANKGEPPTPPSADASFSTSNLSKR